MLKSNYVNVGDLSLHYLEAGEGDPVFLIHGWPTSSYLWRNIIPAIARHRRVIAIDLPGFGKSDKPLDVTYDLPFYESVISGFLDALSIERIGLTVHDLGGPAGLYWASQNPDKVERLAFLNTLVYPEVSWAAHAFFAACKTPGIRDAITTQWSLKTALLLGVASTKNLPDDAVEGFQAPFVEKPARKALAKTGSDVANEASVQALQAVAQWIKTVTYPVRVIYGTKDRALPDIEKTVQRIAADVPHAEITALTDCGHFIQEEKPQEIGEMLAAFFK